MPCRKTELKSGGGELRRAGLKCGTKPLARRTELKRKTELPAPAGSAPKSQQEPPATPKKRQRNTGPSKAVRDALKTRANYLCEYCGIHPGAEAHHRQGRKMGGTRRPRINRLSNLVLLCVPDHEAITNTRGHRAALERAGWLVREGLLEPADVPVEHARLGRVLLLDNGDTRPAPKRKKAA